MAFDFAHERQQARAYLDQLRPDQLSAVRTLLEVMLDPVSRALADAPVEDEDIGEEEQRTVAESRESLKHNQLIPNEEVLAQLGITLDDFERMGSTPLLPEPNGTNR